MIAVPSQRPPTRTEPTVTAYHVECISISGLLQRRAHLTRARQLLFTSIQQLAPTICMSNQGRAMDRLPAILLRCCRLAQALTPIQMATAATESYPWWPDKLAILHCIAQQEGETVRTAARSCRVPNQQGRVFKHDGLSSKCRHAWHDSVVRHRGAACTVNLSKFSLSMALSALRSDCAGSA